MSVSLLKTPASFADLEPFRKDLPLNNRDRKVKTEWVLETHEGTDYGRPATFSTVVTLYSYHSKEGKRFISYIGWCKRVQPQDSVFQTERSAPFSQAGGRVQAAMVTRYSATALEQFHDAVLDDLSDNFDVVAPVFVQAFERRNQDDL